MWHEGVIGIPIEEGEGKHTACKYWVKVYEEGSPFGINGGRICKLTIKVSGKITARYDRGWDVQPADAVTQKAMAILLREYN